MAGQHNLHAHPGRPLHCGVEVIHLKSEQCAVAVGPVGAIADEAVMKLHVKVVQLQDEPTTLHQFRALGRRSLR